MFCVVVHFNFNHHFCADPFLSTVMLQVVWIDTCTVSDLNRLCSLLVESYVIRHANLQRVISLRFSGI